jgi:hypothetical protein
LFCCFAYRVKDGKQIRNDRDAVIIKQEGNVHSLTVNGIKRGDSGKYSCVLTNSHGEKEDTSNLKVRCKPEITQSLKDVEAKAGEKDVSFVLKANAYPEPKIKWFIDEMEIAEERNEFSRDDDPATGTYSLILKEVKSELSGKYTAQVINALGTAKSSAVLSVQCNSLFWVGYYFVFQLIISQFRSTESRGTVERHDHRRGQECHAQNQVHWSTGTHSYLD